MPQIKSSHAKYRVIFLMFCVLWTFLFPALSPLLCTLGTTVFSSVHHATFLVNEQTRRPPKLYTTVFHPEPRLYTLLMVDPDVPYEENQTFRTFLHWLQPNVMLSATKAGLLLPASHTPYLPPHPARGTPYHRYMLLLLPHEDPNAKLSLASGPLEHRNTHFRQMAVAHLCGGQYGMRKVQGFGERSSINQNPGMDINPNQTTMRL